MFLEYMSQESIYPRNAKIMSCMSETENILSRRRKSKQCNCKWESEGIKNILSECRYSSRNVLISDISVLYFFEYVTIWFQWALISWYVHNLWTDFKVIKYFDNLVDDCYVSERNFPKTENFILKWHKHHNWIHLVSIYILTEAIFRVTAHHAQHFVLFGSV